MGCANVHAMDNDGWTELMLAEQWGHEEEVQWLVNTGGAHVNVHSIRLDSVEIGSAEEVVQWLVKTGGAAVLAPDDAYEQLSIVIRASAPQSLSS
eukprot:670755-Rhodomonas_salina.1